MNYYMNFRSGLTREKRKAKSVWQKAFYVLILLLLTTTTFAQTDRKLLKAGNSLYDKGKYKDAELNYRKALENKPTTLGQFNLGDAVYQQKNFDESSKIFGNLADSKLSPTDKANVLHNLGNSLLQAKDYEKSIQAYENALKNNPADRDTKYNLEYAKMMIKKQEQQKQQQKKDQQDKDKKDQKKNEQNKDQKADNKNQQDQSKKISKENADRMLEAMKNDEKKTLQKLKKDKAKVQTGLIEKDW
jgi:Ca-activated chloride channel homolog